MSAKSNVNAQWNALTDNEIMEERKYWSGELGGFDDFGSPYELVMYDGKTKQGPWANMTEESWKKHGCGKIGLGFAQKYEWESNKWYKVAG